MATATATAAAGAAGGGDGPAALRELEALAEALAAKAGAHGRHASEERRASQARCESALGARLAGLEAQVRALQEERKVLLANGDERAREALAIERDAIETAIAASKRAQRLKDELAAERADNAEFREALARARDELEASQASHDLETTRGLDVQVELAQRLEREAEVRRDQDAKLAKTSAALHREQSLHKRAKEKIKAQDARILQLEAAAAESAELKDQLAEMRRLLRAVSKQKPLFDRIHRLERSQQNATQSAVRRVK